MLGFVTSDINFTMDWLLVSICSSVVQDINNTQSKDELLHYVFIFL